MMKHAVMPVLVLLCVCAVKAQVPGSYRSRTVIFTGDSLLLDTMVIARGSLLLYDGDSLLKEKQDYSVDYYSGYLKPIAVAKDKPLVVSYKTVNLDLKKPLSHKPRSLQFPALNSNRYDYGYTPSTGSSLNIFSEDGLKLNGSISRGLGFGNNQDIVLNSNLNLQMSGRLNNDIDVIAAISDENNPIQPEGNTQQLQDFDRVFIQLSKNKTTLTVGDFEMVRPEGSYFMNYYKKSRGGQISTAFKLGEKALMKVGGEGALSRGRFARNTINGLEGNQGPYRLSGTNGELFIIIVSGTEAVYLDGQKLTRGEQNDYIIDYNSGEISFTARRPITQYSRIVVEFQFADRNYARSVFHVNTGYETAKYKLRFNYFTEQDNKNQPFLQTLTDTSKRILASVGDNLNNAVMPSEVRSSFDPKKILYRKTDTIGFTNIYVFAPTQGSDSVFYEVRFSLVGAGRGSYRQSISNANGRVFEWVAPVGGVLQGDYEPVILLVSPKRNQMLTVGSEITVIKNMVINVEVANSFNDKNTFSDLDKNNDAGYGIKASVVNNSPLGSASTEKKWGLKTELNYEYVDQNFRYVERYRNVEFDRTWNRLLTNQAATTDTGYEEHISSFRTTLSKNGVGGIYYQAGLYNRNKAFNGMQNLAGAHVSIGKYNASAEGEYLNTKNRVAGTLNNEVSRYRAELSRTVFNLLAGVKGESEQSIYNRATDTLLAGSYRYDQFGAFVKNTDSTTLKYRLEYNHRTDYLPRSSEFNQATVGQIFTAATEAIQKNGNRLSASFTYREFQIKDTNVISVQPENTILARIEYDYSFIKKVFTANTYYQVGSGQELRRDFQYVKVLVGQGQYVWKDFNRDGSEQLDEFVLAGIADKPQADYIRVFLPTNSFISTNLNQFNQTLNINPAMVWNGKKGVRKVVGKFSNQTAFKTDRKTRELDTRNFLNPFFLNVNDTSLISLQSLFRNTLFFNRSNATFGADISYQNQRGKTFLTNGFEARNRTEQTLNIRWNLSRAWTITNALTTGQREYTSDFFSANNFNYGFYEIKPRLIYQLNASLRITAIISYFEGNNKAELGNQTSTNRELGSELRYNLTKQGVIGGKFSYYEVSFNGDAQSTLGYDMLQGLVVGRNNLWNINFQQRLGSNLQITINYDGRSAEGQKTVHIGRMEARYLF
ncbi:MAG: hypothetical protein V4658_07465 [Bacteroidota bacterium]